MRAIIFSNDKPDQLQMLLDSIEKNASEIFEIFVFHSHNPKFEQGTKNVYKILSEKFINVKFIEHDANFKKNILELLSNNTELTVFFSDNDIIFKPIPPLIIENIMSSDEDVFCFSLRLGENVKHCFTMNVDNVLHNHEDHGEVIKWNWASHYLDFGFPLSLNGHIFRSKEIGKLIKKVAFNSSDELEDSLQIFDNYPREKMAAFKHNVVLNVMNTEILIKELTDGKTLNLENLNFIDIKGCHQNLKIKQI